MNKQKIDRISPTYRPKGKCKGYQTWKNLLFLHWQVAPETIRAMIPTPLEIDTFDGSAWIGLVPFLMDKVRPRNLPSVKGISRFPETNVRTYVYDRQGNPGVWFFSLDAMNRIAVMIARNFWNLNYVYSRMTIEVGEGNIRYTGNRPASDGNYEISADLEKDAKLSEADHCFVAQPDSLLHFLAERYILFTLDRKQRLLSGRVHHRPYPLCKLDSVVCEESLLAANGIMVDGQPDHAIYSPGVEVEVFALNGVS